MKIYIANLIKIQTYPSIVVNKEVVIKGKVVGFDELLMEIKLNQCTIIQN
jgi:hypothetical protein